MNHRGGAQQQMSDAEVMTTAIVAVVYFYGNFKKARKHLSETQFIDRSFQEGRSMTIPAFRIWIEQNVNSSTKSFTIC